MNTTTMNEVSDNYWHKQPWIWFIIGLLAFTMLASFGMLFLAATNAPDLVVDNYSNIEELTNKTRAQDQRAAEMGLVATVRFDNSVMQLELESAAGYELPAAVTARTQNSTLAELDSKVRLTGANGIYRGVLELPANAYDLHIEDTAGTWRLSKRMWGQPAETRLEPFSLATLERR